MKEISIIVENNPGLLAEITELMAEEQINIDDIEAETIGRTGILKMTVKHYDKALKILRNHGFNAVTEESLLVKLKDEPGALAKIAVKFRDANINVRGIHIVKRDSGYTIVAISTERSKEAEELIKDVLITRQGL